MLNVSLEDKYLIRKGRIFVNGTQVLVKLPLIQKALDKKRNLNTSGFISGYRGSPLGNYDRALWQANNHLVENDIKFSPGLNEDLAATAEEDENEEDELANIPDEYKTSGGYLNDGFVVDDNEEIEYESNNELEDEFENNSELSYDEYEYSDED